MLHGKIGVGQGLGLHALGGIHHQNSALTGRQRAGNLVVEVHVTRRIDQVQSIDFPILGLVVHTDGTGLDGDAALPLQVHVVQELRFHLALLHSAADLDHPVRQRGLAVIDVGND